MISIALICDNGYVMPTVVAMVSMIENKSSNTKLSFFVLADGLTPESISVFKSLENDTCRVNIISVDSSRYQGLEKKYSSVSRSSLLKFSIPDIIKELDKILYIDGDVIVKKDISELYDIELNDYYAAVVADGPKKKIAGGKKHAYYGDPLYFNSGMMLLNLKKMREDNMASKLINFRLNEYNYFMDQDAFNRVLGSNVIHISLKYDMMLHLISFQNEDFTMKQLCDFYKADNYATIDDIMDDAVVLHYTLAKPWKYYDIPGADDWMIYYKRSPYSSTTLNRKSFTTYVLNAKIYRIARSFNSVIGTLRKLIKL